LSLILQFGVSIVDFPCAVRNGSVFWY